jgi:hypothetical protein
MAACHRVPSDRLLGHPPAGAARAAARYVSPRASVILSALPHARRHFAVHATSRSRMAGVEPVRSTESDRLLFYCAYAAAPSRCSDTHGTSPTTPAEGLAGDRDQLQSVQVEFLDLIERLEARKGHRPSCRGHLRGTRG